MSFAFMKRIKVPVAALVVGLGGSCLGSGSDNVKKAYGDGDNFTAQQPSFAATYQNRSTTPPKDRVNINQLVLVSGSSHKALTNEISQLIKVPIADVSVGRFADGEVQIRFNQYVGGKHTFIVQTCAAPVNDSIMELLLTISCARRAGASSITAVIPYFGYKHHRRGSAISTINHSRFLTSASMDFAKMLQAMGVDRVIAVDLQRPGQGHEACFFDTSIPLETIVTTSAFVNYFVENVGLHRPIVVVSPNAECLKKAKRLEKGLRKHFGPNSVHLACYVASQSVDSGPTDINKLELLGGADKKIFNGADVIICDDIIDTAGTLNKLSQRIKSLGAERVFYCASHGIFTKESAENIRNSPVERVVISNSLPIPAEMPDKVVQVSIAPLLSKIILSEHFSINMGGLQQESPELWPSLDIRSEIIDDLESFEDKE